MDQQRQQEDMLSQKQHRRLTINSEDRTVARSFSDELMNIFRIDNSVADLDQQVDTRCVTATPKLQASFPRPKPTLTTPPPLQTSQGQP